MRKKSVLNYSGVLSLDTEKRLVKPENHIEAKNVYGTPAEQGGSLFVAPGAVKVNLDSILTNYTIVGAFEEKTTNKVYTLVYVPGGEDRIYLYDPLDQTADNGTVRELCRFTGLDLNSQYLAQGGIIDGKFLVWTESNQIKETIESNGLKKINLERADTNKRFKYRIAVTQDSNPDEEHYYRFYDVNGNPTASAVNFYAPVTGEGSIQARLDAIAAALNAVSGIGAVSYTNYVEVTMVTAGVRLLVYSDGVTAQDGLTDWPDAKYNGQSLLFWAYNHYPLAATRTMFDLCKQPYPCAPFHEFQENPDPLDEFSDIHNGAWQFIVRIHYIDNETSAWSEPSIIATDKVVSEQVIDLAGYDPHFASWNAITVDESQKLIVCRYHDSILTNETNLSLISHVEVAVRKGQTDNYYQVDKINIEDAISSAFTLTFKNDRIGTIIPSDDTFTDIETQVLKKFDWVPRGVGSVGLISEENGNSRIVLGSPLEGYDNIPKADCSIDFELVDDYSSDRKLFHRLKERGVYKFGIEYLDDFGRVSDVIHIGTAQVPEHAQYGGTPFDFKPSKVKISINHTPPSWATRYRIVRTKDLKHRDYFQWPSFRGVINDWKSVRVADPDFTAFEESTFEEATHTLITLPVDIAGSATDQFFLFNEENSIGGFIPQKGDVLRLVKAMYLDFDTGQYYPLSKTEYEILGIHIDVDSGRRSIIVDKVLPGTVNEDTVLAGVAITEVFRPNTVEDVVYLETGNCFRIDTVLGQRVHLANEQNQNTTDPAIVDFIGGDTVWVSKTPNPYDYNYATVLTGNAIASAMIFNFYPVESRYFSIDENNVANSIGRANLEDSINESYVYNRIRYSGISIPNSLVNGLNTFRGGDLISLNETYGAITGLVLSGNTMLAVCFNKIQPIYLNRQDILNIDNAGLLGTSAKLFALASELRGDYGSQHKESIIEEGGNVYGWDKRTGTVWRYDANGINDIRVDTISLFAPIGDYRKSSLIYLDRVFTGYDRRRDLFFIFFKEINRDGINRVFIFDEKKNGWRAELEMIPQMFCQVNDKLLSFYENQLHVHDGIGAIPASYHGYQTVPSVKKVFNEEPTANKIPWAATTQSRYVWEFDSIESPPSKHYEEGQLSRIRGENWRNLSGHWSAPFMRDMNDTKAEFLSIPNFDTRQKTALLRGRHLRGDHFTLSLRMVEPGNDTLFSTEIEYSIDHKE